MAGRDEPPFEEVNHTVCVCIMIQNDADMDEDSGVGSQTDQFDLDGKPNRISKSCSRGRSSFEVSSLN